MLTIPALALIFIAEVNSAGDCQESVDSEDRKMRKIIMKKSIILLLLFVMVVLLITGCAQNSALSDVEITDPSLLRVTIEMQRTLDQNGSLFPTINAYLYDKNDDNVSLKNGALYVNGIMMQLQNLPIGNLPYYTASGLINFTIDSLYTFTIMLADSSKHFFTIRTQTQDIYSFTVPTSISRHVALNVSWLNKDTSGTIFIESTGHGELQVSDPASGAYSFPPYFFSDTTYSSIYVNLHSMKYGTIDTAFRKGSYIGSEIIIDRSVNLTN